MKWKHYRQEKAGVCVNYDAYLLALVGNSEIAFTPDDDPVYTYFNEEFHNWFVGSNTSQEIIQYVFPHAAPTVFDTKQYFKEFVLELFFA